MKLLLKRFKYLLPLLVSSGLALSCSSKKGEVVCPEVDNPMMVLCNRECNYMKTSLREYDDVSFLEIQTTSDERLCDPIFMEKSWMDEALIKKGDSIIEEQIRRWYEMSYPEGQIRWGHIERVDVAFLYLNYEYRSDCLKDMTISANSSLFGRDAGSNLVDMFSFIFYDDVTKDFNRFIFTSDKELKGIIEDGMPFTDYLTYEPIVLPIIRLAFSELPPELPVETDLTVEMTLSNGKTLSDTVHVILTE